MATANMNKCFKDVTKQHQNHSDLKKSLKKIKGNLLQRNRIFHSTAHTLVLLQDIKRQKDHKIGLIGSPTQALVIQHQRCQALLCQLISSGLRCTFQQGCTGAMYALGTTETPQWFCPHAPAPMLWPPLPLGMVVAERRVAA